MNNCGISKQIAEHAGEPDERYCDKCDSAMDLEYNFIKGDSYKCTECDNRVWIGEDE